MAENIGPGLRVNAAEKETSCIDLELTDGSHVYLKSTWETINFSIVVLDSLHAWSRTVSANEVVGIAKCWNIDVAEFMQSAQSHLRRQHPTSSYSISSVKDADIRQLSFTIDDLLEGDEGRETLNFDLRLARLPDVTAVVRDMLDHLLETTHKLKQQMAKAENRFQKKLHQVAAKEPEPSIKLSLARPNANSRRQCSPFVDFTKFNCSEERDVTRSVCALSPVRAHHDQLHQFVTPKVSARLSPPSPFDLQDRGTKQMANSNVEMEREPGSFFKSMPRSRVVDDGRVEVSGTVCAREGYIGFGVPLSPHIMRVLNNLTGAAGTAMQRNGGCHGGQSLHERRDDGDMTIGGGRDDRGVKITEVRCSPGGGEQPPRSFMVGTNSVSIDLSNSTSAHQSLFEEERGRGATTILREKKNTVPEGQLNRNAERDFTRPVKYNGGLEEDIAYEKGDAMHWGAFSGKKKLQGNHNCTDVNGSSNPGRNPVHTSAAGEAKGGSDEETNSKVAVEDAHLSGRNSDSDIRIRAGFSEKPSDQWLNEARRTGDLNEHDQKRADQEPCGPVETRQRSAENRSLESLWNKDILNNGIPSKSDNESLVRSTREYALRKSSCSQLPRMEHQGRKRAVEDRDGDFSGKTLRSVKLEAEYFDVEGSEGDEGTNGARGGTENRSGKKSKHEDDLVDLDDYPEEIQDGVNFKKGETFPVPDAPPGFARKTIYDLLNAIPGRGGGEGGDRGCLVRPRGRGRGRGRGRPYLVRSDFPRGKRQRRRLRSDHSPTGEGNVLDPDEINVDNVDVPDADYSNFDKERTEDSILPNEIWAVYDEKDGFPRVWAWINKVSRHPKFEVFITWLMPHNPSVEAENWSKTSGYPVSCGKFDQGSQHILTSINMFSHRMEFNRVARNVVSIYPRKDEVWALHSTRMTKRPSATPDGDAKRGLRFRVVHILEDVEPEKQPYFSVLEKVKGHRTVYRAGYEPGKVGFSQIVLFSHRVPAHQLQGNEAPSAANLKGSWDVDPAGLPSAENDA